MPLLDHFRPPLSRTHPWRAFHGAWAAAIARLLNAGVLPVGYYAVPFLDRDGPTEIDVATLAEFKPTANGGATRPWTPPEAEVTLAVDWPVGDDLGVEVLRDDGDPRLAAAIELASPRNKDRLSTRRAFVAKCADHLRRGRGLVVVDAVTTRRAMLHGELLTALGVDGAGLGSLTAVAYRALGGEAGRLEAWPSALQIGGALPTLPLWLGADLAVPLDLAASHAAACADLRLGAAG